MNRKIPVIILIVVAVLGGALFGFRYYTSWSEQQAQARSRAAMTDILGGLDFSTTTLERYDSLRKNNPSADVRAQQQVLLGQAYNLSGDYQKGVLLIKEVIADQSVQPETRALAVGFLFLASATDRDKKVFQLILDDDGAYKDALGGGDINSMSDLNRGMNRLFVTADGWYPTSFIKHLLAFETSSDLLDHADLPKSQKEVGIATLKEELAAGETLFATEQERKDFNYSLFQYLYSLNLHFRFFDLAALARFDSSYQSRVDVEYKKLLQRYSTRKNRGSFLMLETYTRFYYAAYLADVFGATRAADIKDIMAPTLEQEGLQGKANILGIWRFYQHELTRDKAERNHNEHFILSIATYDTDFDAFLVSRGWKEE